LERIEQTIHHRREPSRSPLLIEAAINNDPVQPRFETGIPSETADAREELQERILSDIHGHGSIATVADGNRVHLILMPLKESAQGLGFTALTSFEEVPIGLFQHHRAETLFLY